MNYLEVISEVEKDMVTDGLWASDTEKYTDLRNLLYAASVSIASELPLSEFSLTTSTETVANEVPESVALPSDIFSYRSDAGVSSIIVDGTRYLVSDQNTYQAVRSLAGNTSFVEDTDLLFHIDVPSKRVFGVNLGPSIDVEYLAMFNEPDDTQTALEAEEFPLKNKNIREAVSLVSAHLQGNRKRDGQGAQFNMILTNLYGGRQDG
jgi:hypothetical protein